jgi:7,8-dihydropterin-6-yl-methyl-4-(beta-D-ribofuranosyl)aminobenzene 5'-phosphate synthase
MAKTTPVRLTVVIENTVGRPLPLLGEHGFACLVDCAAGRLLFDTGRGAALLHNLAVLGIDAASIDAVILSHGHDDHSGGLLPLLQQIGPRPVYAHPDIFGERYFVKGNELRSIGMANSRQELEAAGAHFRLFEEFTELADGLWFSGVVPRCNRDEHGDPSLVVPSASGWKADPFADDAAVAVLTGHGLVVLLGCAHAGLTNTVEHFKAQLQETRVCAVIGGTHLGPVAEEQYTATTAYLAAQPAMRIGIGHCTGQARAARLYARFPDRVSFAAAGTIFDF